MPKSFSILNPSELDPKQRGRVLGMAIAVATVVFILDLVMPLGVAEAVPYVAVVMITLWSPVSRDTIIAALACTVLTILGFLLSPKGSEVWMAVTNRFLALFVIWATALLALRVKEREESVRAKSQMLTGILNNMPAVAFRMDENGYMTDSAGRGLRRIGLRYQEVAGRTGLEPSAEAKARLREVPPGEPVFYESHGSYDGSPWWFLNCLTSDTIEGKGSIGFGIDITDRKRAERRLSAHHAVANILATCESFTDAAPRILEAIGENLAWELGALWIADQQNNVLRCAGTWHSPSSDLAVFESRSYEITFTRGVGLPGRVWQSGEPAWIPDVTEDPNFPRAPLAAEANLHAAFGFPLTIEGEVAGVMEFFSSQIEEPDEDLLAMFGAIGTFIGQSIERKQAERRLAAHHAVTMILADAASFGEATPRILQAICENLGWQMGPN